MTRVYQILRHLHLHVPGGASGIPAVLASHVQAATATTTVVLLLVLLAQLLPHLLDL
jgi:hypothetical protein